MKLVLLKRIRPVEYEIHLNEIKQKKNLLLTTKDEAFAKRLVSSFNGFGRMKSNLKKTNKDLKYSKFVLEQVSKASKQKISELQQKVKSKK